MDVWDALAPSYDDWYATPVGAYALEAEVAALVALAGELGGVRGIEIGCGTGQFTRAFAQRGAQMIGVDRSAAMLAIAVRKPIDTLLLCRAQGEQLPFPAITFDVALIVTVLEFVPDPQSVLAETWRVLRPRGRRVKCVEPVGRRTAAAARRRALRPRSLLSAAGTGSFAHLVWSGEVARRGILAAVGAKAGQSMVATL